MPELELVSVFLPIPSLARRLSLIIMAFSCHKLRIIPTFIVNGFHSNGIRSEKITVVGIKTENPED